MKPSRWRLKRLREDLSLTSATTRGIFLHCESRYRKLSPKIPTSVISRATTHSHALGEKGCSSTLVGSIGKVKARIGYSSLLKTSPTRSGRRRPETKEPD